MNEGMRNFAFNNDLVRVVPRGGEPWFVGRDVCRCLEIKNESHALGALDDDERDTCVIGTPSAKGIAIDDPLSHSGNAQTVIIISEAGLYRLVFTSRKPIAEQFKRWLAHEVLPALRKTGRYVMPDADAEKGIISSDTLLGFADWQRRAQDDPRLAIMIVREARVIFGKERAALVWGAVGLPDIQEAGPTLADDGFACLRHLLDWDLGGTLVRDAIEVALEGNAEHEAMLRKVGIRTPCDIQSMRGGFFVANSHPGVQDILLDTPWSRGWWCVLQGLPGAKAHRVKFEPGARDTQRATFIPERYLDGRLLGQPAH